MTRLRKLAAIMFTDIEGYSSMMQVNEDRAIAIRHRHREVLQLEHKNFNGHVTQYYGDGTLSIFQSAVEAAQCALAMQSSFREGLKVPVRIGLHLGDIICDDDSIYGDGVNLASRIESLGVQGSVLLSDRIAAELENHPDLETVSLGTYQFKNIFRHVEVFALNGSGLVIPEPQSLSGKTVDVRTAGTHNSDEAAGSAKDVLNGHRENSIAVLPFVNMSSDLENEHFGDCLAEEVLMALARVNGLQVAGRTASFQFRGGNADLQMIRKKLGVSKILEGCVRRINGRFRFTVQLIDTANGFLIWSDKYDRDAEDILAIQEEIAGLVAEKLASMVSYQPTTPVHPLAKPFILAKSKPYHRNFLLAQSS